MGGLVGRDIEGRRHRFQLEVVRMSEAQGWIARHRDDTTEVVITHERLPSDAACTIHADSWEGAAL